jgi:4-hydroxybenzoate polyprenyltransferase
VGGAFVVFCLIASAIYLINDMLDLEADRRHPTKRYRPLASGELSLWHGAAMVIVLLGTGAIIAAELDGLFVKIVITYFLLNLIYSLGAKQVVLLDVIILAVLYGLRIMAGGAAADIVVSDWLMALILFLALSGALMKRYIELSRVKTLVFNGNLSGRGYTRADMALVGQMGMTSGFLAVLVMALYINSTQVTNLYRHPEYWWLVALLLLYGVSRGWLNAYRGKIGDDPIMYIIRDPIYYWIIGLTIVLALLAI